MPRFSNGKGRRKTTVKLVDSWLNIDGFMLFNCQCLVRTSSWTTCLLSQILQFIDLSRFILWFIQIEMFIYISQCLIPKGLTFWRNWCPGPGVTKLLGSLVVGTGVTAVYSGMGSWAAWQGIILLCWGTALSQKAIISLEYKNCIYSYLLIFMY